MVACEVHTKLIGNKGTRERPLTGWSKFHTIVNALESVSEWELDPRHVAESLMGMGVHSGRRGRAAL